VIGSKLHLITEAQGIPLTVILTGATRNNVTQLQALVGNSANPRQAWQTTIEASGRSGQQRLRPRQISTGIKVVGTSTDVASAAPGFN
jgi:hypothetical protein